MLAITEIAEQTGGQRDCLFGLPSKPGMLSTGNGNSSFPLSLKETTVMKREGHSARGLDHRMDIEQVAARIAWLLLATAFWLLVSTPIQAQQTNASITGVVTD